MTTREAIEARLKAIASNQRPVYLHGDDLRPLAQGALELVATVEAERDSYKHHEALIEARTQRGITDCSTPLFIRVENIVQQLEAAESRAEALLDEKLKLSLECGQILGPAYDGVPFQTICRKVARAEALARAVREFQDVAKALDEHATKPVGDDFKGYWHEHNRLYEITVAKRAALLALDVQESS